jgi:hypothetical protein
VDILNDITNKEAKKLTERYRDKIEAVKETEMNWTDVFRAAHIFGALCIAVNFVASRLKAPK